MTGIFCLLATGNVLAEEADTLKVVDVEEITVIAAPKEKPETARAARRRHPAFAAGHAERTGELHQESDIRSAQYVYPRLRLATDSAVYIRGIARASTLPPVGLYVDNIPYIDKSAFDFSYADVERIDVLRGPQGTLYGRNAMGGLIKVHTKSPFSYQGRTSAWGQVRTMPIIPR